MYKPLSAALIFLMAGVITANAQGRIRLEKYETPDARLVFLEKNTSYLVPHTIRSFQNSLGFHKEFWDYTPSGQTNILFNDFNDIGNGGTMVIPWNYLNIGVAPFDYSFSVVPTNERMQWLMSHELAHQVMCDMASKSDRIWRTLLGGKVLPDNRDPVSMAFSYLTTPRWYSPRWYHEGIAVFMETWMSGGIGRVLGGYDEMVFRTMVRDSSWFYNVIGLETEGTAIDFQVGVNSYLYGTRFVSYLAEQYGIPKLKEFYTRTDSSRRFYASQFKEVYGTPIQKEWDRWISFEHKFQAENLDQIRQYPVTPFREITGKPLGSVSRQYYDARENAIIMAVNYPKVLSHIAKMDLTTGKISKLAPVAAPGLFYVTSIAYDDSTQTIFASTQNKDWRGLQKVDAVTGKVTTLARITRCGNLVFDRKDRDLWAIQSMSGRTSLVRFKPPYKEYEVVLTMPYGQELFDPDISPDGSMLSATLSDVTGRQQVVVIDKHSLLAGKKNFTVLYEFEDNPASNFVFSPDSKYLYGTSYYTGVSNIYRIRIETREMEILSNSESGFFRPLPVSADSLMFFNYTHEGMVPAMMKIRPIEDVNAITLLGQKVFDRNPEVESWLLPPPTSINLDSLKVTEKRYRPMAEMRLAGAYPIIQGYKQFVAPGYKLNFMDPMGLNSLIIKASITPDKRLPGKQIPHVSAEYNYWNWTFTGNYNYADFYDLFGPTKFSRAGYSLSTRYHWVINRFTPARDDFYVKATMYGDLETLPNYQNIESDYRYLFVGYANYHKSWLRKSLGAIEPEQGYDWNVYAYTSFAKETFYPQLINNFDFGFLLPFKNSSLWFRTSMGQSFGDSAKTNSYFYFGGFGNNYLDYRSAQQYREMQSFPGVPIDELSALNYGKGMVELNFTPLRFRRLGVKSLYITYARLSTFGMGLFTNLGNNLPRADYYAAGAQLDFEIVLFSLLKSTLSVGYSNAIKSEFPAGQWMFSLKL